jgi:hypothetical protein
MLRTRTILVKVPVSVKMDDVIETFPLVQFPFQLRKAGGMQYG